MSQSAKKPIGQRIYDLQVQLMELRSHVEFAIEKALGHDDWEYGYEDYYDCSYEVKGLTQEAVHAITEEQLVPLQELGFRCFWFAMDHPLDRVVYCQRFKDGEWLDEWSFSRGGAAKLPEEAA